MKFLAIDDHPVIINGLVALLSQFDAEVVVLTARDVKEGEAVLKAHNDIDLVLLDLVLPDVGGHTAISTFGRLRPSLPIVIFSSSEDPADVRKALQLGALGYIPKSSSRNTLYSVIRLVLSGERYVPPFFAETSANEKSQLPGKALEFDSRLTARQVEVMTMLSSGQSNKDIARRLSISVKTVKIHTSAIFRALKVSNRTQAAAVGRELGLI